MYVAMNNNWMTLTMYYEKCDLLEKETGVV